MGAKDIGYNRGVVADTGIDVDAVKTIIDEEIGKLAKPLTEAQIKQIAQDKIDDLEILNESDVAEIANQIVSAKVVSQETIKTIARGEVNAQLTPLESRLTTNEANISTISDNLSSVKTDVESIKVPTIDEIKEQGSFLSANVINQKIEGAINNLSVEKEDGSHFLTASQIVGLLANFDQGLHQKVVDLMYAAFDSDVILERLRNTLPIAQWAVTQGEYVADQNPSDPEDVDKVAHDQGFTGSWELDYKMFPPPKIVQADKSIIQFTMDDLFAYTASISYEAPTNGILENNTTACRITPYPLNAPTHVRVQAGLNDARNPTKFNVLIIWRKGLQNDAGGGPKGGSDGGGLPPIGGGTNTTNTNPNLSQQSHAQQEYKTFIPKGYLDPETDYVQAIAQEMNKNTKK